MDAAAAVVVAAVVEVDAEAEVDAMANHITHRATLTLRRMCRMHCHSSQSEYFVN